MVHIYSNNLKQNDSKIINLSRMVSLQCLLKGSIRTHTDVHGSDKPAGLAG